MSMTYSRLASRSFIMGIRLWPPAINRASLPSRPSRLIACSTLLARSYSKGAGTCMHPPVDVVRTTLLPRTPLVNAHLSGSLKRTLVRTGEQHPSHRERHQCLADRVGARRAG